MVWRRTGSRRDAGSNRALTPVARRSCPRSRRAPARELAISSDAHAAGRRCRFAAAACLRCVRPVPRSGRPRHRMRVLLGAIGPAPVPAMCSVRSPAHSTSLPMVRSASAIRPRGAVRLLGTGRKRRCHRARTQVRGLACRRGWNGRANGPSCVAPGCSRGANSARASAAFEGANARARIQSERVDRARPRGALANPRVDRPHLTRAKHRDANSTRIERPLAQRGRRIRCFQRNVEAFARCPSRARGRRGHDGRDVERVRRVVDRGRCANLELRHLRPSSFCE